MAEAMERVHENVYRIAVPLPGDAVETQCYLLLGRQVALAAAESLGRVGSVSAVAWLRATATDRRAPVVLRNAATAAIAFLVVFILTVICTWAIRRRGLVK